MSKTDLQICRDIELYETLLHRSIDSFIDSSTLGDYELAMRNMAEAVTIMGRLEKVIPPSKINRLWASAWKGTTKV